MSAAKNITPRVHKNSTENSKGFEKRRGHKGLHFLKRLIRLLLRHFPGGDQLLKLLFLGILCALNDSGLGKYNHGEDYPDNHRANEGQDPVDRSRRAGFDFIKDLDGRGKDAHQPFAQRHGRRLLAFRDLGCLRFFHNFLPPQTGCRRIARQRPGGMIRRKVNKPGNESQAQFRKFDFTAKSSISRFEQLN